MVFFGRSFLQRVAKNAKSTTGVTGIIKYWILLSAFASQFSNSLIILAALTQLEHLILVRWMGLETQ